MACYVLTLSLDIAHKTVGFVTFAQLMLIAPFCFGARAAHNTDIYMIHE